MVKHVMLSANVLPIQLSKRKKKEEEKNQHQLKEFGSKLMHMKKFFA